MPYGTLPRTALLPIISDVQTFHSFIVPNSICMWNSKILLQFYFLFSSGKALAGYHEPLITLCFCPIRTILCWLWTWTPAFLICCSNGFPYRLNKLVSRATCRCHHIGCLHYHQPCTSGILLRHSSPSIRKQVRPHVRGAKAHHWLAICTLVPPQWGIQWFSNSFVCLNVFINTSIFFIT